MPELDDGLYRSIIIKGFIDAKTDKQDSIHGTFLGLSTSKSTQYIGAMFSHSKLDPEVQWADLLKTIQNARASKSQRDAGIVNFEEQLEQCIDIGRIFQNVVKTHQIKMAEQNISRFCNEQLQIKAVTFIQCYDATDTDISIFTAALEEDKKKTGDEPHHEDADGESPPAEDTESVEGATEAKNLFIRCEPILDPVGGVAMSELNVGDVAYARLPEDSPFFKLFSKNFPDFDGVMTGEVSGVFVNELGTATVSLVMTDGVSGLMKMSGKVRIKVGDKRRGTGEGEKKKFHIPQLPPEAVFAAIGVVVIIGLILVILYVLN